MIKTNKNCFLVFLVVFAMIFNIMSLSAYAEGEVVINATDDGSALSMAKNGSVTRSFEITAAGDYSLTVNAKAILQRSLSVVFDENEAISISLTKGNAFNDTVYFQNISFSEGSHSVTVTSPDGSLNLMKLTLTLVSESGGEDGGSGGEDQVEPGETTEYTIECKSYTETNITASSDLNNWSGGETFTTIRSGKYMKYELEAQKGHYKVMLYAGTSENSAKYTLTNEKNGENVTATLTNTGSYGSFAYHELGSINLENGLQTLTLSGVSGASWDVRLKLTKISDYVILPIEDEKILSDLDVFETYDATYEDGVFTVLDGGSVTFIINTAVDVFNISAALEEESGASLNIYINDELIAQKASSEIENMGDYIFDEGEKKLKIEAVGGSVKLRDFKVKKVSVTEGEKIEISKSIFDYMPGGQGVGYNAKNGVALREKTDYIHFSSDEWVKYEIDAPKAGDYLITICYSTYGGERIQFDNETNEDTTGNVIISASGGINTFVETSESQSGDLILTLEEGKNIIKFTKPYNDLYLKSIKYSYINYDMNVQALYVGDYPVWGTNLITPSSDTMKIYMTNPVTTEKITNEIAISGSDGKSISYDASISENVISLDLKDSLSEYTDYEVTVSGLSSEWGTMESKDTVNFSTGEEKPDGVSEFKISSSKISGENITVEGILYGSHEKPINDRYLKAYISKKDNPEKTFLAEVLSKDGGKVKFDMQLPSGSASGEYIVYIEAQYTDSIKEIDNIVYVDSDTLSLITSDFKDAATIQLVKDAFDTHKDLILYDVEADATALNDSDAFYAHFISYEFESMNDFYEYYDKMYVFEKIKQKGASATLYNEENCEKISVDYGKISLIVNNKDDFTEAVDVISETEYDKYISKLNEKIDEYLLEESEKNDVFVTLSNETKTYGQGFNKDIYASSAQDKLKKVIFNIECNEQSIVDSIFVSENSNAATTIKKNGKLATVEVVYNELYNKAFLFNLSFTATQVGTHEIKFSGNLIFDFNGYDAKTDIVASNFILTATNATSQTESDKTSEGSFSTGGSYTPSVTPDNKDETNNEENTEMEDNKKEEYSFSDISEYEWAEESIIALVNKGVISKPADKKYRPGDNITREEFVKMIVSLLNINMSGTEAEFSDLNKEHWAYDYIAAASKAGIVLGMGDGSFGIGSYITREQMATISARILDKYGMTVDLSEVEGFSDENNISDYAKSSVKKMRYYKIINGVGDNVFAPKSNATRAETAKIIYGLAKVVGL